MVNAQTSNTVVHYHYQVLRTVHNCTCFPKTGRTVNRHEGSFIHDECILMLACGNDQHLLHNK